MNIIERIALHAVYVPLCLGIVAAAICRINLMTRRQHKLAWWAMYAAMAVFAAGELIDVLRLQRWMSSHELVGLVGIALNLVITRRSWRSGVPDLACKPERMNGGHP